MWEVCWAAGGDFHLKVLAGLVLSQQVHTYVYHIYVDSSHREACT